MIVNYKIS